MVTVLISTAFWVAALIREKGLLEGGTFSDLAANSAVFIWRTAFIRENMMIKNYQWMVNSENLLKYALKSCLLPSLTKLYSRPYQTSIIELLSETFRNNFGHRRLTVFKYVSESPDTNPYMCVSGGKNFWFFEKFYARKSFPLRISSVNVTKSAGTAKKLKKFLMENFT